MKYSKHCCCVILLVSFSWSYSSFFPLVATPNPVVQIVTDGNAEPGESYKINCTVTVVSRLIVPPVITWIKTATDDIISVTPAQVIESKTRISLCLTFSSLKTSDAAMYTCKATITVNQINMVTRSISYVVLSLTSKWLTVQVLLANNCVFTCTEIV